MQPSNPLLDSFRRKEVARDVRLLVAQGGVTPRPLEQLGILALLSEDEDPEIRTTAEATLQRIPVDVVSGYVARSDMPSELKAFFVSRGITPAASPRPDSDAGLFEAEGTDTEAWLSAAGDQLSLVQQLATLNVPQKVKAAMKGNREVRAVLARDPNKIVSLAVLSSPKLSESEVESIARMGNVSEDVLRTVAQSRAWTKNYNIVVALVRNAKTPLALTLTLLNRLNEKDLKTVSVDHNVPEPLRAAAKKKVALGER